LDKRETWRVTVVASGLMAIAAAIPLLLVTYPPLNDLPNHLGRIAVLKAQPGDPLLEYYEVNWQVIPNLGTDLLLLGLSSVTSIAVASKLLFTLCTTLWLAAPVILHRAVYGRISIVPLIAGLFLFNPVEDLGFLNFWLGSSLAVTGFAIWVTLETQRTVSRAIAGVALTVILFLCHLFAFATFAVAIVVWEVLPARERRSSRLPDRLPLLGMVLAPAAIGLLVGPRELVAAARTFSYEGADLLGALDAKFEHLLGFVPGGPLLSTATWILLGLLILVSLARRTLDRRLAAISVVVFGLFLLLPYRLMTGVHVDWRMLAPLVLFVGGAVAIDLRRWQAVVVAVVLVAGSAAQSMLLAGTWQEREATYAEFEPVVARVPAGSKLLYGAIGPRDAREHYAGYAVVERDAVVPSLFALTSQQPIRVVEPYRSTHRGVSLGWYPEATSIDWRLVTQDFAYVLLASRETPAVPANLTEVATNGQFRLYRVNRP
jgi:hypothetical protein